jgi:hypothetical protein
MTKTLMILRRFTTSLATAALLLGCSFLRAADQPATPSFSSTSEVIQLSPPQTQFGTFRQGNPGATLNFRVYNLPATSDTTSPMSMVHNPPFTIGDSAAISLQSANVSGLQPVGTGGTPNALMQLIVTTNQVGNLQVSYQLEFSSDSVPTALHKSLAIAAYATVLLHGDYNADGKVDAGDYIVWRRTRGQTVSPKYSRADDDGDGFVTDADYAAWRSAFAGASGSGSSVTVGSALSGVTVVPEPATVIVGLLGATFIALLARPRKRTAD